MSVVSKLISEIKEKRWVRSDIADVFEKFIGQNSDVPRVQWMKRNVTLEQLGFDDEDFIEFLIFLEKEFKIAILDTEVLEMTYVTMGQMESVLIKRGI